MSAPRFDTITGDAWKRGLAKARARRSTAPERITKAIRLSAANATAAINPSQKK